MRIVTLTLAFTTLALTACRKSGSSSSFPTPAALPMAAGTFITGPGVFESVANRDSFGQAVDFRVTATTAGKSVEIALNYEARRSPQASSPAGGGSSSGTTGNLGPDWFCFVEKPGTYWVFDGRRSLHFREHNSLGSRDKSILQDGYLCRDNPKIPSALLDRLPADLSKQLSPPSGKDRPSF